MTVATYGPVNPISALISVVTGTVTVARAVGRMAWDLGVRRCAVTRSAAPVDASPRRTGSGDHQGPRDVPHEMTTDPGSEAQKEGSGMARRVAVVLEDDLTGEVLDEGNGETMSFGLDGQVYEIDLSEDNAAELRRVVGRYTSVARKVDAGRPSADQRRKSSNRRSGRDTSDVRAWARKNGHRVSERGRIPAAVLAAYEAAH